MIIRYNKHFVCDIQSDKIEFGQKRVFTVSQKVIIIKNTKFGLNYVQIFLVLRIKSYYILPVIIGPKTSEDYTQENNLILKIGFI